MSVSWITRGYRDGSREDTERTSTEFSLMKNLLLIVVTYALISLCLGVFPSGLFQGYSSRPVSGSASPSTPSSKTVHPSPAAANSAIAETDLNSEFEKLSSVCPEYTVDLLRTRMKQEVPNEFAIFKHLESPCIQAINSLCSSGAYNSAVMTPYFSFFDMDFDKKSDFKPYESLKELTCDVSWYVDDNKLDEWVKAGLINSERLTRLDLNVNKRASRPATSPPPNTDTVKIQSAFPRLRELEVTFWNENSGSLNMEMKATALEKLTFLSSVLRMKHKQLDKNMLKQFPKLNYLDLRASYIQLGTILPSTLETVRLYYDFGFRGDIPPLQPLQRANLKTLELHGYACGYADDLLRGKLPVSIEKLVFRYTKTCHDRIYGDLTYLKNLVEVETSMPIKLPNSVKKFVFVEDTIDLRKFQRIESTLIESRVKEIEFKCSTIDGKVLTQLPSQTKKLVLTRGSPFSAVTISSTYDFYQANNLESISVDLADRNSLCELAKLISHAGSLKHLKFSFDGSSSRSSLPCGKAIANAIPSTLKDLEIVLPLNFEKKMMEQEFADFADFRVNLREIVWKVLQLREVNDHGFLKQVSPYLMLLNPPTELKEKVMAALSRARNVVLKSGITTKDLEMIPENLVKITVLDIDKEQNDLPALGSLLRMIKSLEELVVTGKSYLSYLHDSDLSNDLAKHVWSQIPKSVQHLSIDVSDSGLKKEHLARLSNLKSLEFASFETSQNAVLPKTLEKVTFLTSKDRNFFDLTSKYHNFVEKVATELAQIDGLNTVIFKNADIGTFTQSANILKSNVKQLILRSSKWSDLDRVRLIGAENGHETKCVVEDVIVEYEEKEYSPYSIPSQSSMNDLKTAYRNVFGKCESLKSVKLFPVENVYFQEIGPTIAEALPNVEVQF